MGQSYGEGGRISGVDASGHEGQLAEARVILERLQREGSQRDVPGTGEPGNGQDRSVSGPEAERGEGAPRREEHAEADSDPSRADAARDYLSERVEPRAWQGVFPAAPAHRSAMVPAPTSPGDDRDAVQP